MMNRFLCFRPFCKKADVDSEKAESPAFVAEEPAFGDLGFQRLALKDSPDSYPRTDLWCDKTTELWRDKTTGFKTTDLWRDKTTDIWRDEPTVTFKPVVQPRLPSKYKSPGERRATRAVQRVDATETRKDAEKRKDAEAAPSVPAEKKARKEPSSYAPVIPESESD
jgi:hypothetical protein